MAIIKCKMCGGDLEITSGITVAECEYCGTKQTLPKADDEVVQNLFNRANNLRIKCEFDKAEQIYEKILQQNDAESEAHWGIVLCKYGIEYVEDPKTFKRIPTCHRTSYDAVTADADYLAAVEHADGSQRSIYEAEAKAIDEIQKNILNIVKNEKPFDVFICYKETDENGKRTVDSAIANDIYYQLTQEGMKVFYAAITLEDKLGQEYEPYIFAALNSAKVMLVIGTKPQNFTAVWVKNEWSRFLKLMKSDRSKLLIPCYRDMDAYDLPEEFSHLQAQDMSKIGFINDVVRGIRKIAVKEEVKKTVVKETVTTSGNANTAPLLKRAFMFLEDGEWDSANEYCEKVLDIDPENAFAYLGKLMAELHVRKQDNLKDCANPFDGKNNYQKAVRFADDQLKNALTGYIEHIKTRNENARLEGIYSQAKRNMNLSHYEQSFLDTAKKFESISGYKDSAALAKQCYEKAEITRKNELLSDAKSKMTSNLISRCQEAIQILKTIPGWKDADEKLEECEKKVQELELRAEQERLKREMQAEEARKHREIIIRRNKKIAVIAAAALVLIITFIILLTKVFIPNGKYKDAVALMDDGKYVDAMVAFYALDGYRDSAEKITECEAAMSEEKYCAAVALMEAGKYQDAILAFELLGNYKDSVAKIEECKTATIEDKYAAATDLMKAGEYQNAITAFEALDGYKDSAAKIEECKYNIAVATAEAGEKAKAAMLFGQIGDYRDAKKQSRTLWDSIAVRETISAGGYTVGLKADGTVVDVGSNSDGLNVSGWTDIVAISTGGEHTVGLKADGTVVATKYRGPFYSGQCDVSHWTDIVAISAGSSHTVGLKADGTVVAVGDNEDGQCNVSDWRDIVAICAGGWHTVGLKADGTVVATSYTGDYYSGQCDVSDWTDIVAISAGSAHTVGLKADGTIVVTKNTGIFNYGQCDVIGWTNFIAISAGGEHTVGLKADGTVVAVGYDDDGRCDVAGWTDILAVSAGESHTVGLKADGTVVTTNYTGEYNNGQCDVSDWTDILVPKKETP